MTLRYLCCHEQRREAIRQPGISLNGIDYLEVLDQGVPEDVPRQQLLLVRLFQPVPNDLTAENVHISGGERITPVRVLWAIPALSIANTPNIAPSEQEFLISLLEAEFLPDPEQVFVVRTDTSGDFSTYRLSLVRSPDNLTLPDNFDPILNTIDFSFKVECPSEFDCRPDYRCLPGELPQPDINYLAKDYASFRQLMLDRMALLAPQWQERHPADLGITLVELLAYVGDRLSYQQDAIFTEAYLGTARRRISVRRHARLMDYLIHDGRNARTWVQLTVDTAIERPNAEAAAPVPKGTPLLTPVPNQPLRISPGSSAHRQALATTAIGFEIVHDVEGLYPEHNQMNFYTWGATACCLPRGATRATLVNHFPNLRVGEVLIFEEVLGPSSGTPDDADPTHRHAVRLVEVESGLIDPLFNQPLTQIGWHEEDALPFPLCISTATAANVSVVCGNIVLADHGQTIQEIPIWDGNKKAVPESPFHWISEAGDRCHPLPPDPVLPRFSPQLRERPLTQVVPYDLADSAWRAMHPDGAEARPAIKLQVLDENGQPNPTQTWLPRRDLLSSNRHEAHFVVEVESDGTALIRFGDGVQHGDRPPPGTAFAATYRVGNGIAGQIGAEALTHIVIDEPAIIQIRNPLPAWGGQEPESIEEVRQRAPHAFREQQRAVTLEDYARITEQYPGVQKAVATSCWTGSWYTIFITVDRVGGQPIDAEFEQSIRQHLERYRMAGQDVEIDAPIDVSLELELWVCVKPEYFRSEVKRALLEVFSDRLLPNGQRGIFHPDQFTFGQPVYLSSLYATAQAVAGVSDVEIRVFQRQNFASSEAIQTGRLTIGRLEIARLANDPNFPEHGILRLILEGGK